MLCNEAGADEILSQIPDPNVQNVARMMFAELRMRFLRLEGESDADYAARLPAHPFDAEFFVRVVAATLREPGRVRAVLDGASIAEATGWDV